MWWRLGLLFLFAGPAWAADCATGPAAAAAANAASVNTMRVSPFGRAEQGWRYYVPLIAREARTACGPGTRGFAAAVARLDRASGGVVDNALLLRLKATWQGRRPFVRMMARGCPPPPAASALVRAGRGETLGGKDVRLRPEALRSYRAMVAAARRESSAIRAEPRALQIFSGFRDPEADAARCLAEGNCDGTRRARCSPHRTGLALDLWVGQAPGYGPDSTADPSRRVLVETASYRWLVLNADRFGFVNYAFEPWHWEWRGAA